MTWLQRKNGICTSLVLSPILLNLFRRASLSMAVTGLDRLMKNILPCNHAESYWAVENVKEASEEFLEASATLVGELTKVGASIHLAIVADPFDNHIGFLEGA